MKATAIFFGITLLAFKVDAQTATKTKEIKITYSNGYEEFNICESGCLTSFDDNKEYYWYTDFSKIKSTKGGSGGSLLHGDYKFFDPNGNLRLQKNYYLGLPDGVQKSWDSLGNIIETTKYSKGAVTYWKFQNQDKYWIEWFGSPMSPGSVKKVYTQFNRLESEESFLPNYMGEHVKTYYEKSGKLEQDYYCTEFGGGKPNKGKYVAYYENGKIEIEGKYLENDTAAGIKVGTWKYYKEDGMLDTAIQYKAAIEYWDNGKIKQAGEYIYDTQSNTWLKNGWWRSFNKEGMIEDAKTYKSGIEVDKTSDEAK